SRSVGQLRQVAVLSLAEISRQLPLMPAGCEQVLDFRVAPRKAVVRGDVIQRHIRPPQPARSHWAFSGRTRATICRDVTSARRRPRGTDAPVVSERVIPCNMTCSPPGSSFTVLPGGITS